MAVGDAVGPVQGMDWGSADIAGSRTSNRENAIKGETVRVKREIRYAFSVIEMDLEERVLDITTEFSVLHSALIDFVVSMRSISQKELFKYTRLAILTVLRDSIDEENQSELQELDRLILSTKTDPLFDPLPFFQTTALTRIVSIINKKLTILDFEIVQSKDMDVDDAVMYSFVNKKNEGSIKAASAYSLRSIELIKAAIDRIFNPDYVMDDNMGGITYQVAYMAMVNHIRDEGSALSYDEAEHIVQTLELQGWLERYHDKLTLTIRGLSELGEYLINTYKLRGDGGSISVCFGCEQIITRGYYCPNDKCYIRMHKNCKALIKSSRESDSCPNDHCSETLTDFNSF